MIGWEYAPAAIYCGPVLSDHFDVLVKGMRIQNSVLLGLIFVVLGGPALAKHKVATVDIFSPPADQVGQTPLFVRNGKPIVSPMNAIGAEEPNWDNAKTLPDVTADQTKVVHKYVTRLFY